MSRNPYTFLKKARSRKVATARFAAASDLLWERVPAESAATHASKIASAMVIARTLAEAIEHHRAGRLGEPERLYRSILAFDDTHSDALHRLGMVAFQTGHPDAALGLMQRATDCGNAAALGAGFASDWAPGPASQQTADLGMVLQSVGRVDEALACYDRALALNPNHAAVWSNRGLALEARGRLAEAEASLERALELSPGLAVVHSNLGNLRKAQGRLADALAEYEQAVAIAPEYAEGWSNLAGALELFGRYGEAMAGYERALRLKPDLVAARVNRSMLRLLHGEFASGLPEYELRHRLREARVFASREWRGEALNGQTILIHCEQGLGDAVQFLRYLPLVQQMAHQEGGQVVLEVPTALRRLANAMPGMDTVMLAGEALPQFDWHCSPMSLPLVFGTNLESIPARVPYLAVPAEAAARASALPWPDARLRVGLVWAGNPGHPRDRYRSLGLEKLAGLLRVQGVRFYSLQMGAAAGSLDLATPEMVTNLPEAIEDLADTAAILDHLDLVIAVDTAVAHLAGALGRPVWVMLPIAPDWRWLLEREDSPWYPTMRLFRQTVFEDWDPVVERVRRALMVEVERYARDCS